MGVIAEGVAATVCYYLDHKLALSRSAGRHYSSAELVIRD